MANVYCEDDYCEEDYVEAVMAITPLPDPPLRGQAPAVFIERAEATMAALPVFAVEANAAALAMTANSTNSTSSDDHTLASTGSKTFTVQIGKSYVVGMTVRAAAAIDGTAWMQGDVTAYNAVTGSLSITMNAKQGTGSYSSWVLCQSSAAASAGSLTQDFSVKSLIHATGTSIASASTIDLSAATGNTVHITGGTTIAAATMTAGKDVRVIFDGAPQLTYHATTLKLNSGGANITAAAGDVALFTYDGTTVRVEYTKLNGKANVETAAPAGAPVGSCLVHFGPSPPTNYLTCPTTQTNLNRTTYATLFTAIGTTWGVGDSSTTFGMPWFAADYAMLQASSNVGSASTGTIKAHTHDIPTYESETGSGGLTPGGPTLTTTVATSSTGGSANLAAGSRVLICVKYQ